MSDHSPSRWPALMRPDTLREYLDCRSASDFARKCKELEKAGYKGPHPILKRHVKAEVDRCLERAREVANGNSSVLLDDEETRKKKMLEAARGKKAA